MSAFEQAAPDKGGLSQAELRALADQAPATFHRSLKALLTRGSLVNTGTDSRPFYLRGPAA